MAGLCAAAEPPGSGGRAGWELGGSPPTPGMLLARAPCSGRGAGLEGKGSQGGGLAMLGGTGGTVGTGRPKGRAGLPGTVALPGTVQLPGTAGWALLLLLLPPARDPARLCDGGGGGCCPGNGTGAAGRADTETPALVQAPFNVGRAP
ncbi:uncharacterized PE-PGRS family protein PE_PGRS20-like [Onychostruthus taczanowskii]|uniref:uncharacterized PE-PGRS family protein PE_PGRS20-like n=1 Tax=Onychostruthus taczanowskii TaxID=356909 RepID=UPI001B805022|nr:uncharacterized PE-PGRS family protein PE_PGRS20-like [Onychostruthus taczanowskii]